MSKQQSIGVFLLSLLAGLFAWLKPKAAPVVLSQATAYPIGSSPALVGHDIQTDIQTKGDAIPADQDPSIVLGIRSNNPLNIRYLETNQWRGLVGESPGGYCIFSQPVYGIRAAAIVLRSYRKRGVVTLADIVATWAPHEDDNPTQAYINNVSTWTGIDRDALVVELDYPALLAAMIRQENGSQPYTMALIIEGVTMA